MKKKGKGNTSTDPKIKPIKQISYKIGDSFFSLPLSEAQDLLRASSTQIDSEVATVEESLSNIRGELQTLKVALYARFGRSINLET